MEDNKAEWLEEPGLVIWRERDGVGGYDYRSMLGEGHIIWNTSLVSLRELHRAIAWELEREEAEKREKLKKDIT